MRHQYPQESAPAVAVTTAAISCFMSVSHNGGESWFDFLTSNASLKDFLPRSSHRTLLVQRKRPPNNPFLTSFWCFHGVACHTIAGWANVCIRSDFANHCGISRVPVVNVLALIILHNSTPVLLSTNGEHHAGFRPARGCIDQVVALQQLRGTGYI